MYYQKDFNEINECKITFEQLSYNHIINEVNKCIEILKALEHFINARMIGYDAYHTALSKSHASYEILENSSGTLKYALDSFFVYTGQVSYDEWFR